MQHFHKRTSVRIGIDRDSRSETAISSGPLAFESTRDGLPHIYVCDADGASATRIGQGAHPAWAPCGRRIAFHRSPGGIFVVDADGSNGRWLCEGWNPDWSPDGAAIVFNTAIENADISGAGGICVMDANGSGCRRLMSHAFASPGWGDYGVCWPSWSPDGRRIAFVSVNYARGFELHVMNADGSCPYRVASACAEGGATWAPDGSALAFETCTHRLRVARLDGSTPIDLTDGCVSKPDWLPNEGGFLFARRLNGAVRVFVYTDSVSSQLIPDVISSGRAAYRDSGAVWCRPQPARRHSWIAHAV